MIGRNVAGFVLLVMGVVACQDDVLGPEQPLTFLVIEGACGEVMFSESIGADRDSAMAVIEERKAEQFGEGQVMLDSFRLKVVDENGNPPEADFYAIRVLDAATGSLVHSISEVVTTDGDLFILSWCPD